MHCSVIGAVWAIALATLSVTWPDRVHEPIASNSNATDKKNDDKPPERTLDVETM